MDDGRVRRSFLLVMRRIGINGGEIEILTEGALSRSGSSFSDSSLEDAEDGSKIAITSIGVTDLRRMSHVVVTDDLTVLLIGATRTIWTPSRLFWYFRTASASCRIEGFFSFPLPPARIGSI